MDGVEILPGYETGERKYFVMAIIFKPILPKKINDKAMLEVLASEVSKYSPYIKQDFEKTVAGWKMQKPTFAIKFRRSPSVMSLSVAITGNKKSQEVWGYLNYGTKPHRITPKRAKRLRFPSGTYQRGSSPGRLNTYPASKATGPDVYAKAVNHPGFPARDWLKVIKQTHEKPFTRWMNAAMSHAARVSGHSIK